MGVIPFKLKRVPGTQDAIIWESQNALDYPNGSKVGIVEL
jgi:hypothetical protein